jgi:hypothetical protein
VEEVSVAAPHSLSGVTVPGGHLGHPVGDYDVCSTLISHRGAECFVVDKQV